MVAEEAEMAEAKAHPVAVEKVDIKVEDGVMSAENDPSHEKFFDKTSTAVKVKTEFIPEAEDGVNDIRDVNNPLQVIKNETSESLTEQPHIWLGDPVTAGEGRRDHAGINNGVECGAVRIKEEYMEGEVDDNYAAVSFEHHADFDQDDKSFQTTIFCKETDADFKSELDSKTNLIHVSLPHSEASTMKDSAESGSNYSVDYQKFNMDSSHMQHCGDFMVSAHFAQTGCSFESPRLNEYQVSNNGFPLNQNSLCKTDQLCSASNATTEPDKPKLSYDSCFAKFGHSTELQQHLLVHSSEHETSSEQNFALRTEDEVTQRLDVLDNNRVSCEQPVAAFRTESHRVKHLAANVRKKRHLCAQCPARFKYKSQLTTHLAIHSSEKPFMCSHCGAKFNNKGNMKRHSVIHSSEKPFSCPHCDLAFQTKLMLQSHLFVHSNEKPFTCAQCSATFKTKLGFTLHASAHSSERQFACEFCPLRFKTKPGLRQHLVVHSSVKLFSCSQCSATFRDKCGLSSHLNVHSTAKPFKCAQCLAVFKTKQNLKVHVAKHSTKVTCEQCAATFNSKKGLRGHQKRHANKRYSCRRCVATFETKCALMEHSALHSKEISISCLHCAAKFRSKPGLKKHISMHLNEKLISCGTCAVTLKLDSLLGKLEVRLSNTSFSCVHCKAKFKSELAFRLHSAVHLKEKLCTECAFYVPFSST